MKNTTILLLLLITFTIAGCSSCKKNVDTSSDNPYGLPNATQEGKNTLGFLLNGQPWTPKGQVGLSANLTVNVDLGYNQGVFVIGAYRYTSSTGIQEPFTIGIRDSLKFFQFPITVPLSKTSLYGITYRNVQCDYFNQQGNVQCNGNLTITKLDKSSQILSGTFNATFYKPGCDTIKITEGRFDMKY